MCVYRKLEISGPYPMLQSSPLHSMAYSYSEMEVLYNWQGHPPLDRSNYSLSLSQETTDTEAAPFSSDSMALNQVLKVVTPGNRLVVVPLHEDLTIEDVLHNSCRVRHTQSSYITNLVYTNLHGLGLHDPRS